MGDQGRWFKLWVSALGDPSLDALPIAQFGRWAKLGAYVKAHGVGGTVVIVSPASTLVSMLQCRDFDDMISHIQKLPNVTVSLGTNTTVTFANWMKYQGDFSTERVRKFRKVKRLRREEKRRESFPSEKISSPTETHGSDAPPQNAMKLVELWNKYAAQSRNGSGQEGLPLVRELTASRLKRIRVRLREEPDLAWWEEAIRHLAESSFACGKGGWRASFDWLLANDTNAVKAYEGRYDDGKNQGSRA